MSNDIVLACDGLSKTFSDGNLTVEVLREINLQVKTAEQIAIVGQSGSGKSTLLHILGGLDEPSQGQVWVAGQELHRLNPANRGKWRNKHLGFVYQFHHLLQEFTALENVAMPLLIRGEKVEFAQQQAAEILAKIGLAARLGHKPGELSGGERQRTAIARAMVTQPSCILADEPTGNLDRHTAYKVYEQILQLNQQIATSFVLVTHDPQLAQHMDRSLQLVDGRLVPI